MATSRYLKDDTSIMDKVSAFVAPPSGVQSRRRNSMSSPPSFRIVLVGHDWLRKNKVGNLLLGRDVFETNNPSSPEKNHNKAVKEYVLDSDITVANTAELFTSDVLLTDIEQKVKECVSLCTPGPHALVLVVNAAEFTTEKRKRMEYIVNTFSDQAFQHSILFLRDEWVLNRNKVETKRISDLCGGRIHHFKKTDQAGALHAIKDMVSANNMRVLTCDIYETPVEAAELNTTEKNQSDIVGDTSSNRLNLVMCGSNAEAMASAADLILGEQTGPSPQPSSESVKREAEVCGRHVTLVLLSALGQTQLSEEALWQEAQKCVNFCDPGIHAILRVYPQGRHTDDDKKELNHIQQYFGKEAEKFYINLNTQQQTEIVETQAHILDHNFKVKLLLEDIERMKADNGYYTPEMYSTAQVKSLLNYKTQLTDTRRIVQQLQIQIKNLQGSTQDVMEDSKNLRIVLLGMTGEGKSATGNTILGRGVFNEDFCFESVTTVCQKETATISGRQITVVDTPGLFDTETNNEEIKKEIIKCIGMAAPGPHVFLLVKALGRYTQEQRDTVSMIQSMFGDESGMYTLVLFTGGDKLKGKSFDDHREKVGSKMNYLLQKCGNRYHVIDNTDKHNKNQVSMLLTKIDSMVKVNGGKCYTNEMFQKVEERLKLDQERILRERDEEIEKEKKKLQAKHEEEIEKLKREIESERTRQNEERERREEEFRSKEQNLKTTMQKLEQDEKAKSLAIKEDYERRKKENEEWINKRISEVQTERKRQQEEWEKKKQTEQKMREEEEEKRKTKEMEQEKEWQERQRLEFKNKMDEILKASKEEETKKKQEYEEKAKKEEEKLKDLEEKIKHAQENKVKELQKQKRIHEDECQRNRLEEEKRRLEEEFKWKNKFASMNAEFKRQQRQEKDKYEREKQIEKQRRDAEEERRKMREEEERQKIEQDAQRKIKEKEEEMAKLQLDYTEKLQREEMKIALQRAEMEAQLKQQRKQFEKQKEKEAKVSAERERKNMDYLKEVHEKEKELLKRETEMAARKQAEEEFNEELDRKVKEAKSQGLSEGFRQGHKEGKKLGIQEGHEEGFEEGEKEGYAKGFEEGEEKGHATGFEEGEEKGYMVGVETVEKTRTGLGKFIDGLFKSQEIKIE